MAFRNATAFASPPGHCDSKTVASCLRQGVFVSIRRRFATPAVCVVLALACGGCGETEEPRAASKLEDSAPKSPGILIFPDELRVKDESANRFLAHAMKVCGDGQYEPFRLLWSVKEEPLPRGEFDQGWQAVREIRIRAFQEVLLADENQGPTPTGETVYVVFADVSLDPKHRAGEREPQREVALMLMREKGNWRLAKAPPKIRNWLKNLPQENGPVRGRIVGDAEAPTHGPETATQPDGSKPQP